MKVQEAQKHLAEIGTRQARKELRERREGVGLTQFDLSKRSGVKQSNLNRIESGKQGITPRTFAKLMTAIENKNEETSGISAARARVALCERLPWMQKELPEAKAKLAELELAARKDADVLNNPIVLAVMESYKREIEQAKNMLELFQLWVNHDFTEDVLKGEQWAVEAQDKWRESGGTVKQPVNIEHVGKAEE